MKIPFWATVLTLLASIVLFSLGTWQMHRMAWKNTLLQTIARELSKDPKSEVLDPDADLSTVIIKRGVLQGEFLHEKAVRIESQVMRGQTGYNLVTPFKLSNHNGKVIFVNRGWIPLSMEVMDGQIEKPQGEVRLIGALRSKSDYNSFVPENKPEEDVWYRIEPKEIAAVKGIDAYYTNIFHKEGVKKRGLPDLPIARGAGDIGISNNHAGYVLFWFTMSFAVWVIYFLRFIAPQLRKDF